MKLTLTVGTKNWSSWSLRGWLPVKLSGLPFEERLVRLRQDDTQSSVKTISPSGLVPLLKVEDGPRSFEIWDSLAIAEFMAEIAPLAGLWPGDPVARAKARAVCAEMHSGFPELRRQYSMEFARHMPGQEPTEGTAKAIARIKDVWTRCLDESGGPYLFGAAFGNADAFYAPIVSRFHSYDVRLDGAAKAYADAVWHHPLMREWFKAAADEVAQGLV
ncbi:MAG: glutathione S-transferase family protein [Alphaproteobacteria bacterium]|nr:glutathione S-transferase family protein [Alphaproteobacteria bacterium]